MNFLKLITFYLIALIQNPKKKTFSNSSQITHKIIKIPGTVLNYRQSQKTPENRSKITGEPTMVSQH